ncbi:Uncharacterised protein [Mycobacteroides abscessus subsp. abscessus]|nr:Uncharacterised protein [Mycobacteroides abscessus subsp. abscessus]
MMTLEVRKFSPALAANSTEFCDAAPYQSRSISPAECGCTRSENSSMPFLPLKALSASPRSASISRSTRR